MRCDIADFVHQRVGGVAGAVGVADVAVGEDGRQRRDGAGREGGVVATGRLQCTVPLGSTPSMPSRQPSSRPTVRSWIGVGGTSSKLPIIATPQVLRLNPPVWKALDRFGEPAGAALEHLAVLVDQCVVGDVAPAQGFAVVGVDGLDDAGRLQRGVVVAARGVVDHRGANPVVVLRGTASQRLVGAPFRSADDGGRLAGHHDPGRRRPLRFGRCLRRRDEDRGDVLPEGLFPGRRPIAKVVSDEARSVGAAGAPGSPAHRAGG